MKITANIFYVYLYLNPCKPVRMTCHGTPLLFAPVYVGKGSNNRVANHMCEARNSRCIVDGFLELYNDLKKQDLAPIAVVVKKGLSHKQALNTEKRLILKYKKEGFTLLNKTGPRRRSPLHHLWQSEAAEDTRLAQLNRAKPTGGRPAKLLKLESQKKF